jgi:hypothetical protein
MVAGALMGFGFIGLMSIGLPFLVLGTVMAVAGLLHFHARGSWAFPVGFGGLPALLLTVNMVRDILRSDWSCSSFFASDNGASGSGSGSVSVGPGGEEVICTIIPGSYLIMALMFWGIVLFGLLGRYAARRMWPPRASGTGY